MPHHSESADVVGAFFLWFAWAICKVQVIHTSTKTVRDMRLQSSPFVLAWFIAAATLVSGCGGSAASGSVPTTSPSATPTQLNSATTLITTGPQAQTTTLPSVGGYAVTMTIPAATTVSTILITVSTSAPKLVSAKTAFAKRPLDLFQSLLYVTLDAQGAASLLGTPGFSITLPTNVSTSGVNFYLTVFDPLNPSNVQEIGPAVVAGSTATFSTGTSALTFQAGQKLEFGLFALPNAAPTPTPGSGGTLHKFVIPGAGSLTSGGGSLLVGPDHNFWIANPQSNQLLQMTPSGIITTFATNAVPLTIGGDGAVWGTFAGTASGNISRTTSSGTTTAFTVVGKQCAYPPNCDAAVAAMTLGPDGNLWFVGGQPGAGSSVFAIDTSANVVHEYDLTIPNASLIDYFRSIVVGSDGALWFSDERGFNPTPFERITTTGNFSEFPAPQPPGQLVAASDGNIWATEPFDVQPLYAGEAIERTTTSGTVTQFPVGIGFSPQYMAQAPDGSLWFTEAIEANSVLMGGAVGHMNASGTLIQQYVLGNIDPALANANPTRIVVGPDGAAWFIVTTQSTTYLVQLQP